MTKCVYTIRQRAHIIPDDTHSVHLTMGTSWFNAKTQVHRRHQTRKRGVHITSVVHSSLALLILFTSVHIVSCQNTLAPSITSSSTTLEESKPANLTCTLRTTATPTTSDFPLSWSRNGGLPAAASTTESQQADAGGEVTYQSVLTFAPTALDNEIDILCYAKIDNLTGLATYSPPVILVPDDPVITGPSTVDASDNQTWKCEVDGASRIAPNVYWRNGRGEALTTGVTKSTTVTIQPNQNTVYLVTQYIALAVPATGPEYNLSCIVVHELGQYNAMKTSTKTITVLFPPEVTKNGGNTVYVNEGQQATLSCVIHVSSPPATNVSWTKDGASIDLMSSRYGPVNTSSPSLIILSALRGDRGDYVCTAANSKGSTSFTTPTTLVVRYAPAIGSGNETTIEGSVGGSLTIPCPVNAVPPPTAIVWKRIVNGQAQTINITGSSRYSGGSVDNQQYNLTINPVQSDDAGVYFCEAVNGIGTGTGPNQTAVVDYKPIVNIPASFEAQEGYNFTIPCTIIMYPTVTSVTWFKGNTQLNIAANSGKYSGGTVQNASLIVRSAVKDDSGTYRCQGSNGTASVSGSTVVTVTYPPKVSVPTSDITRVQGQTATILCTVDAAPSATIIEWRKQDIGVSNTTTASVVTIGGRISGGNLTTPTLTISNLEPSDMSTYYCIASNRIGNTTSRPVNLRVQYKPIVQVSVAPAVLRTGESFQLSCTADANPTATDFKWYKGNVLLSNTANFTQTQATISDYTDFRCSVTNSVGVTTETIRPNIQFTPQLNGTGKVTIFAKLQTNISLDCLVIANPEPTTYAWYKEGILISSGSQKTISILLSNETEFGSYKCSAENSFGSLNPAREFTVFEDKTVVDVLPSLEAQEGYTFTIPCRIFMYPAVTSVVWFKGNTQLNIAANSGKYSGGTVQNASLEVRSAVKDDSGTYKCQGSNGTASVSGSTNVTITFIPKVTSPTSDVIGNLGKTAVISCNVDAVPPATSIEWRKQDIGASNNTSTVVTIGGRISGGNLTVPSLTISNLEPSDTATYYCIVSNKIGNTTSNPANLVVHYKPVVRVSVSPSVLNTGESFQLSCTADASPAATRFQWYKGSVLLSSTANFTRTQATASDYTDFQCSVTNPVGITSETVKPNIQFKPQLVGTGKVTIYARIETNITLDCLVLANPEPTVYAWYKQGVLISMATRKTMSVFLSNDTDFGSYNCSAQNSFGNLNPAREFTVVKDTGSPKKSSGLSTSIIILIAILSIIFLILLILLIVCCCLYGICAKKRKKSKVDPDVNNYNGDNKTESRKPSILSLDRKPNGNTMVNGDAMGKGNDGFITLDTPTGKLDSTESHGSIISVPEKTGARPYHLPPLDSVSNVTGGNVREDEKRRSRRKKQKTHKNEDKSALTRSEERTDSNSPTT